MTPDQKRAWLAQWDRAAVELDRVHTRELEGLTDERALAASDALLSLARPGDVERRQTSGLVAQQRLFSRLRK